MVETGNNSVGPYLMTVLTLSSGLTRRPGSGEYFCSATFPSGAFLQGSQRAEGSSPYPAEFSMKEQMG